MTPPRNGGNENPASDGGVFIGASGRSRTCRMRSF